MNNTTSPPVKINRSTMFARRKRINYVVTILALCAVVFGLIWLFWILFETLRLGFGGLNLNTFTKMTPAMYEEGGLLNSIAGSSMMVALATFVGTPIGVLAGIYLVEFNPKGWLSNATRFVNDILLSAPSIIIGIFVYTIAVKPFHYSGFAGSLALALIVIPVVIRTTEGMLQLIPSGLREAAYALGAPKWKVVLSITLKAARTGVITGVLLAVARIAGETAPLLFTALNNQFWSVNMTKDMASLPVTIYDLSKGDLNQQQLAWTGVFLITLAVLALNILARVLTRAKK